ncbi:MAG: hypothetical protein CMM67_03745 [Rhodospirillaceae bacterium]|nr:hypothetical protein [Rhodospirillaceae bacterium]OUT79965.1 MAG: hypothetical protein CBB83_03925 [Rhodospirillaceae bacterium TMED23]|tara:strand:- start:709 stop:945 length:237 start_codon:yes stop_codon:yes gene_type:complete
MSNNGSRNEVQEVLFEFIITGNFVKVIAVDPRTNTEISIVGDRRLSKSVLQRNAIRKLVYVLEKKNRRLDNNSSGHLV